MNIKIEGFGRDISKKDEETQNKAREAFEMNVPLADSSTVLKAHESKWDINEQHRLLQKTIKELENANKSDETLVNELLDKQLKLEEKIKELEITNAQLNPKNPELN